MPKKIPYTIHEFSELYNEHDIPNPTWDEKAIYYKFMIWGRQFLQTHKPYVEGILPVYREDADVIEAHIAQVQEENSQGVEMTEGMAGKVAEAQTKKAEVDAVRNLFNLGNL